MSITASSSTSSEHKTEKVAADIATCVRQNIAWPQLPVHLRQVLHNNQRDYEKFVFNYSLKNQLRFRGNIAARVFRHEQRYYELLVQKSINGLGLFPYHLADIVTKGLRVTPFNYYLDVLAQLLRADKSYDTLPNFTAADCLRVLGIGRNEYLSLISDLKTQHSSGGSSAAKIFGVGFGAGKANPFEHLPRFPRRIRIQPWWRVEVGYVLEADIRFVTPAERSLIDDLIDFGSQAAGRCDAAVVHSLYRKGLVYVDVPVSGEDRICIPPLRNFVMNRVSGDYFENLLYTIFVSADEHMTIAELAQMLQVDLDSVKQAVSLFCRLGFACRKEPSPEIMLPNKNHSSWGAEEDKEQEPVSTPITPLNYNSIVAATVAAESGGYLSSDGNQSDFSFANMPPPSPPTPTANANNSTAAAAGEEEPDLSSELDELSECTSATTTLKQSPSAAAATATKTIAVVAAAAKTGKRVGFLFDSTLTAFLMMGNLSPGLKHHAVTMFEVGKLCEESLETFLAELEKVSLLDAEGEGDVSRYFTHAIILRSTICALRHLLPGGLDLLRLECLEGLDQRTRDRVLEKKYKFIISAAPLTANLSQRFSVPFFGQFYRSAECSHMWTKLFYNHITGYGPPSLFLCRGAVLKTLPRLFLGYGKLLINILHSDSYVINSENFRNLNEQLKNGCVLIQGYGIRQPGELRYEAFPFDTAPPSPAATAAAGRQQRRHKAVQKLSEHLDLERSCGYLTFLNTGVPDIGCDAAYELAVRLRRPKNKVKSVNSNGGGGGEELHAASKTKENVPNLVKNSVCAEAAVPLPELFSPGDGSEVTSFARLTAGAISPTPATSSLKLKSPDENYFAANLTPPQSDSPSNVFTSADCSELLASELAKCGIGVGGGSGGGDDNKPELVSQGSVEIPLTAATLDHIVESEDDDAGAEEEEWTLLDVHFGVPLFDVDCNTRICEQIVRRLCHDQNLSQLATSADNANELFLQFVQQCLHFEDERGGASEVLKFVGKTLPQPRINLAFENGRVCYWSGR